MQKRQQQVVASFHRVTQFLTSLPPATAVGKITAPLAELSAIVADLSAHAVTQNVGHRLSKANTRKAAALRRVLRVHNMQPVASMAKALLTSPGGYDRALTMPAVGLRSAALVTDALAMAKAAEPYAASFIAEGLSGGFLARLTAAARAVQDAVASRAQNVGNRSGATQAVKATLKRGHALVTLLNAIVTPAIEGNAVLIGEWKAAKGTRRAAVPPIGTAPPSASAPAAAALAATG